MRSMSIAAAALIVMMTTSCGGGPTEEEINRSVEAPMKSVAGAWIGFGNGTDALHLDFTLQEADGKVTGTGSMKENSATAAVPIAVSGTFQRPILTLAFDGMVYEAHQVKGTAQGSFSMGPGFGTTLTLTAPGYSRDMPMVLQKNL